MKKSKLLLFSVLMVFAFVFASCGSAGEKAKEETAVVECDHDHAKDHECKHAKKDTCAHTAKDTCDHDHSKVVE